ncbi:MAG: hypothetical protein GKR77_07445 [Legionellales bacterium]|nr:hypothetical protein [Legionellales bacterium]
MISLFESLVIVVVMIMVFGPNQWPQLSQQLGRWWLRYQQWYEHSQQFIEQQAKQAQLAINEQRAQQAEQSEPVSSKSDKPSS